MFFLTIFFKSFFNYSFFKTYFVAVSKRSCILVPILGLMIQFVWLVFQMLKKRFHHIMVLGVTEWKFGSNENKVFNNMIWYSTQWPQNLEFLRYSILLTDFFSSREKTFYLQRCKWSSIKINISIFFSFFVQFFDLLSLFMFKLYS